jgi:hypothetical protein
MDRRAVAIPGSRWLVPVVWRAHAVMCLYMSCFLFEYGRETLADRAFVREMRAAIANRASVQGEIVV